MILTAHAAASAAADTTGSQRTDDTRNDDSRRGPVEQVSVQGQQLRSALAQVGCFLDLHPSLSASEIVILGLATVPPPRFANAAGAHFPQWRYFDGVIRCDTVRDVMAWCDKTGTCHSLIVRSTGPRTAVLRLGVWINGGFCTVTTSVDWLAEVLQLAPRESRSITLPCLTAALEAHARRAATTGEQVGVTNTGAP